MLSPVHSLKRRYKPHNSQIIQVTLVHVLILTTSSTLTLGSFPRKRPSIISECFSKWRWSEALTIWKNIQQSIGSNQRVLRNFESCVRWSTFPIQQLPWPSEGLLTPLLQRSHVQWRTCYPTKSHTFRVWRRFALVEAFPKSFHKCIPCFSWLLE